MSEEKNKNPILENKVSSDIILEWTKKQIEDHKEVPRELWIEIAFKLTFLRIDEAILYNKMKQAVAIKKLEILKNQTKRNVAAVNVEVESLDEYRFMQDQEDKIYSIDECVRVAKKSADINL